MGAGVPVVIQTFGWGILASALFIFGIIALIVTGASVIEEFKDKKGMSVRAWLILFGGGFLTALFLGGGIYGVVRVMGQVGSGYGLG